MDWTAQEDERPKMSEGYHKVTCTKLMTADREGKPYAARDGSPQLRTIWANASGEDTMVIFTLSEKAAWTLRVCLQKVGANVDRLKQDGVQLEQFEDEAFASKVLIGKSGWAHATQKGEYINLKFVDEEAVPVSAMKQDPQGVHTALDEDQIPW